MKFNGLMIDCSRLIERHEYYFEMLDFMGEWKMNTLLFHFSDDFGCSIKLPGFEELAVPNSFSLEEVKALVCKAKSIGVDIIPEIETFGHTRYITDHSRYSKLRSNEKSDTLGLNALNPFIEESLEVVTRLIEAVSELFPSQYLHIGCDEVDLGELPEKYGVPPDEAWANYVNKVIGIARNACKTPMIWADHLANCDSILKHLRKDVILVDWRYACGGALGTDSFEPKRYSDAGFEDVLLSPAMAMFFHRWLPNKVALQNVKTCNEIASKNDLAGVISTIWVPFRYQRDTMYYGIAFSAYAAERGGVIDWNEFNTAFAEKVFGASLSPALKEFLTIWPDLIINHKISAKMIQEDSEFSETEIDILEQNLRNGDKILSLAKKFSPVKNIEIWNAMVLAAKAVWLCSQCYYAIHAEDHQTVIKTTELVNSIEKLIRELDDEWDRTRYPEDPQKSTPRFTGWDEAYNLVFFNHLFKIIKNHAEIKEL